MTSGVSGRTTMQGAAVDPTSVHLLTRIECLLEADVRRRRKKTMREEVRSLEFWRAIIAECLATFFYVFLVCGTYVSWPKRTSVSAMRMPWVAIAPSSNPSLGIRGHGHGSGSLGLSSSSHSEATDEGQDSTDLVDLWNVQTALTSGFAMCTLILCFGHISGAHVNPALTLSLLVTQKVTAIRAVLYIIAQCGGAIAGAALLYGVTVPGHQGTLGSVCVHELLTPWQGFGVEFVLSFIVVFTVFAAMDPHNWLLNLPSPIIGSAYLVCTLAGLQSTGAALNPARALGPAFVMNRWENHWVYWIGSVSGGLLAGLIYEYIFDPRKGVKELRDALDEINRADSSFHSQDDDYDDADAKPPKFSAPQQYVPAPGTTYRTQNYDNYRPNILPQSAHNNGNYSSSHNVSASSNYGPLPPPGRESNYGVLHKVPSSHYGGAESLYSSTSYRPHSTASGNYATIHGNRPGTASRAPQRMEYGPGSTKF